MLWKHKNHYRTDPESKKDSVKVGNYCMQLAVVAKAEEVGMVWVMFTGEAPNEEGMLLFAFLQYTIRAIKDVLLIGPSMGSANRVLLIQAALHNGLDVEVM